MQKITNFHAKTPAFSSIYVDLSQQELRHLRSQVPQSIQFGLNEEHQITLKNAAIVISGLVAIGWLLLHTLKKGIENINPSGIRPPKHTSLSIR